MTERECELFSLFARDEPYARIAESKGISPVTDRNTISRIQDKLGLATKQELIAWALKKKLVPLPVPPLFIFQPTVRRDLYHLTTSSKVVRSIDPYRPPP